MMETAEALALAVGCHQAGDLRRAEAIYRLVLQADPNDADAWHLLGVAAHHAGRSAEAVGHIGRAVALDGARAVFHGNLGLAYAGLGRPAEAEASYREALRLLPGYAHAHNNLGALLHGQGRFAEAEASFGEAVRSRPDFAEAHNNLGAVLAEGGRFAEAEASFGEAVRLRPDYAEAHSNRGATLAASGRIAGAEACHREALRLKPDLAEAHNGLGDALYRRGRLAEAIACCREAVRLRPGCAAAHKNLAAFLQEEGDWAEALACLGRAQAVAPDDGLKIRAALVLPVIYASAEEVEQRRRRVEDAVSRLRRDDLSVADPLRAVGATAFELAYQGRNDRDLQAALADVYARAAPSLAYVAPHCARPDPAARRPIRIGFISRFFYNHTIGRLNAGLIRELSRADFRVVLLRPPGQDDATSRAIRRSADEVMDLPEHLGRSRRLIAEQRLGVLFYTDVGMDPLTYFLAFARLAPVQCAAWGHPVTTGVPAVDYFVSSDLLETEGAEAHYTETLVRLRSLSTYYERPSPPAPGRGREQFGLPPGGVYGCPQSLFKFLPEFDGLLAAILRRDPHGTLVLSEGKHARWGERLRDRFARTLPDVAGRIRFLPRLGYPDFLRLNAACDVLLDPIPFGGGITAYDALALGVPIVTRPSPFLRGRITSALYRKMGVPDCVAAGPEEYVELAVRLGTEPDFRADVRSKILAAAGALYEDAGAVREVGQFLREAVARAEATRSSRN